MSGVGIRGKEQMWNTWAVVPLLMTLGDQLMNYG